MNEIWANPNPPRPSGQAGSSLFDALRRIPQDCSAAYQTGLAAGKRQAGRNPEPQSIVVFETLESSVGDWLAASLAPVLPAPIVKSDSAVPPAFVRPQSLVIVNSVASRGPECLQAIERTIALGATPLVISRGGREVEAAVAKNVPLASVGELPSFSTASLQLAYFAALGAVIGSFRNPAKTFASVGTETLQLIERQCDAYAPEVEASSNPTRALADAMRGQNVVFVSGMPLARAAGRYALTRVSTLTGLRSWHVNLPDDDAWSGEPPTGCGILLHDGDEPDYLSPRIADARRLFNGPLHELQMDGPSAVARLWSTITLIDWASFYLAP